MTTTIRNKSLSLRRTSYILSIISIVLFVFSNDNQKNDNIVSMFVNAYPTGAGSCVGGEAAVGGSHVDQSNGKQVIGATLAQGKVGVKIDNGAYIAPEETNDLSTQTDYTITLETEFTQGFKGVLLRLEVLDSDTNVDTTGALTSVDANVLKICELCEAPVVGLTQVDSSPKISVEARMRLDQAATNVRLDVTMVAINNETISVYGYDAYYFSFNGDSVPATPSVSAPAGVSNATPSPTISTNIKNDITGTLAPTRSDAIQSTTSFILWYTVLSAVTMLYFSGIVL